MVVYRLVEVTCCFGNLGLRLCEGNGCSKSWSTIQIPKSQKFHFSDPLDSLCEKRLNPCELKLNQTSENS